MAGEFCVVCGRTDVELVDALCPDCFARRTPLVVPEQAPVVILCPTCGARKIGSHWERRGSGLFLTQEDLNPFLSAHAEAGIRRVQWVETGANPLVRDLEGVVDLRFRGTERHEVVHLSVRIQHHTCDECSRRAGHYFTATIQLRGPEGRQRTPARQLRERLEKAWDRVIPESRAEWRRALSWKEELPEGWDYFLTDTLAARGLARLMKDRLGAELKESATLWGRKNGQDVYRVTFCLRVPADGDPTAPAGRRSSRRVQRQV